MNKDVILLAIEDHFNSVTPEEVIKSLEDLGCEFEDVENYELPYSHLEGKFEIFSDLEKVNDLSRLNMRIYKKGESVLLDNLRQTVSLDEDNICSEYPVAA